MAGLATHLSDSPNESTIETHPNGFSRRSFSCWLCKSSDLVLVKPSNLRGSPSSDLFAITESNYGVTGSLYRCVSCGFLECPELNDVVPFYQDLEDAEYEEGRAERSLQAKRLLERLSLYRPHGRLLDIGAGSGILVEEASRMGYEAEGVEPSRWLQGKALDRGLPVHLGTLPHPDCKPPYDIVTLIDVIEHVTDPLGLLASVRAMLEPGGLALIVTPDVKSVMARLLGWSWWHFRVAHVGYFDRATLQYATEKSSLRIVALHRPSWYFSADYLFHRVLKFAPAFARFRAPRFLGQITVPLNLRDSWLAICRAENRAADR